MGQAKNKEVTEKKELPSDHPLRMRFETTLRKKYPRVPLFIPRWDDKFGTSESNAPYAGTYKSNEIQSMWEGYQLGYRDALDVATTKTYPEFDINDLEGYKG